MPTEFTPVASLLGGLLIGGSAVWLMASLGRIAGVSGMLGRLLSPQAASGNARIISLGFVVGMLLAPVLFLVFSVPVQQEVSSNWLLMGVAGVLVGMGTSIGSGCTSGHGVCGLSRLSTRSLVATVVFMLCAGTTVYIIRHLIETGT